MVYIYRPIVAYRNTQYTFKINAYCEMKSLIRLHWNLFSNLVSALS